MKQEEVYYQLIDLVKNNLTGDFKDFFIKQVLIIEDEQKYEAITSDNLQILFNKYTQRLKKELNNKKYYNKLKFYNYTDSINDKFHSKNIILEQIHPQMTITTYDKEIYKFDNRLDEYRDLIGIENSKLGYINISVSSFNNHYRVHTDAYLDYNIDDYYRKNNIIQNKDLCKEYVTGLLWNLDFYLNLNDNQTNNICTWNYSYNISPFIVDLYNYLNTVSDKNIFLENIYKQNYLKKIKELHIFEKWLLTVMCMLNCIDPLNLRISSLTPTTKEF